MKNNRLLIFILLFIGGTLFLLPNFYRNKWNAVDSAYYDEWQIRYDRLVIARLAKTQQDGFLSAGGLLGLGDATKWNFLSETHHHQYDVYFRKGEFKSYLVYESNPGFQGILYGTFDRLLTIPGQEKIKVFRGFTAILSALTLSLIFTVIAREFGLLAGLFTLLFSAFSIWLILPAGSIFWNLWAFFLPFLTSAYLLADSARRYAYNQHKIHFLLFGATLLRILLSGFDIITTGLIMSTVPYVFYSIYEKWEWKLFLKRFVMASISLITATLTGLLILSAQIIANNNGSIKSAFSYVEDRFGHHFAGNSEYYTSGGIEATKISIAEVTGKYLVMPAINIPLPGEDKQILYWHLILLFAACTILYFFVNKKRGAYSQKATALIIATWYSLSAPLSWIILFRPHSIIHTHVNTMGWQMPFTLMGFALCGYVITDLFKRKAV
jgi:hypothetical protein